MLNMGEKQTNVYYGANICSVITSGTIRDPVLLCDGKLYEIQRYMGLHCEPRQESSCWTYCFVIESDNTDTYRKIILEKEENSLVVRVPPYIDRELLLYFF